MPGGGGGWRELSGSGEKHPGMLMSPGSDVDMLRTSGSDTLVGGKTLWQNYLQIIELCPQTIALPPEAPKTPTTISTSLLFPASWRWDRVIWGGAPESG